MLSRTTHASLLPAASSDVPSTPDEKHSPAKLSGRDVIDQRGSSTPWHLYEVMDYAPGMSLQARINSPEGPLSQEYLTLANRLLIAVEGLHKKQWAHGNLRLRTS